VGVLKQLPTAGVTDIDVICPGFAVDCLETLEEIAMQNRDIFVEAGGQRYQYIPALNDTMDHVEMLMEIIESELQQWLGRAQSPDLVQQAG
jgi:ferrochelatase